MIQTILCAVDINRPDDVAKVLQTAQRLAATEAAQLDVITVIPDFGMSVVGGYFNQAHQNKALSEARNLLKKLVAETVGAEVSSAVRHIVGMGNTYHEILTTAHKAGADLIVLGAHRPDLKDYLLGPNAARVVRHAQCSVYVVR